VRKKERKKERERERRATLVLEGRGKERKGGRPIKLHKRLGTFSFLLSFGMNKSSS
jgi:hypothetical protein